MKKIGTLLLTLAMVLALFAGCTSAQSSAEAGRSSVETIPETGEETSERPTETVSDAHVQEGMSLAESVEETTAVHEYTLPLTTTGETLTMFAITNSNVTDNIGELGKHQVYVEAEKMTGVHVEIRLCVGGRADQFSLGVASGDWPDMGPAPGWYPAGVVGSL